MMRILLFMFFPDIDSPISQDVQTPHIDRSKIDTLVSFGFEEELACRALKASVSLNSKGFQKLYARLFY